MSERSTNVSMTRPLIHFSILAQDNVIRSGVPVSGVSSSESLLAGEPAENPSAFVQVANCSCGCASLNMSVGFTQPSSLQWCSSLRRRRQEAPAEWISLSKASPQILCLRYFQFQQDNLLQSLCACCLDGDWSVGKLELLLLGLKTLGLSKSQNLICAPRNKAYGI